MQFAISILAESLGLTVITTMKKLTRTDANFCLDVFLLITFVLLCTCATIVEFVFPPGPQADGWLLWGHSYVEWSRFEFGVLSVLAAAILLHIMLHWTWVCGVVASRLGRKGANAAARDEPTRTLWGVGLLIFVVNVAGVIVALAVLTIHAPVSGP